MGIKKSRRIEKEREDTLSDMMYNEFYQPYEISMDRSWELFMRDRPEFAKLLIELFGIHARNLHLYVDVDITEQQAPTCMLYLRPPVLEDVKERLFQRGIG